MSGMLSSCFSVVDVNMFMFLICYTCVCIMYASMVETNFLSRTNKSSLSIYSKSVRDQSNSTQRSLSPEY